MMSFLPGQSGSPAVDQQTSQVDVSLSDANVGLPAAPERSAGSTARTYSQFPGGATQQTEAVGTEPRDTSPEVSAVFTSIRDAAASVTIKQTSPGADADVVTASAGDSSPTVLFIGNGSRTVAPHIAEALAA